MKLRLLRVLALAVMLPVSWALRGQTTESAMLVNESFENGIPEGWTQEYVSGTNDWVLDTRSDFPDGTREGDGKRIAFRNETGQTQGWRTKLVTPVYDLSLEKISNPILIITHAQEKLTGDFDTLTIWFKTAADGEWKELEKFDSYISFWQTDTITLAQPGAYYQLAFEGSDNYGHGVVIDNVIIMPNPACQQPRDLELWDVSNTTAQIFWNAGNNAVGFNIKVDTVQLTMEQLEAGVKASIIDEHITGSMTVYNLENLDNSTTYYFYVQAECPMENSPWSEGLEFRTTVLETLPFHETFDTLVTGYPSYNPRWVFMSEYDELPYNNTDWETGDLSEASPDGTVALIMGEDYYGSSRGIEANKYMYVASPRFVVDDMSQVQVSFYASYNDYGTMSNGYMSKIYVGGMTNPTDHNTFVAVDSVEFLSERSMEKVTVSFIGHEEVKECKYIAFYSDFDAGNFMAIDDVNVWIPGKCPEPANVKAMAMSGTDLRVTWNRSGAQGGNVVVSQTEVRDFSSLPQGATKKALEAGKDTVMFTVEEWTEYYVYVQNVAADGSESGWSEAKQLRMPQNRTIPVEFDFEADPYGEECYVLDPYAPNQYQMYMLKGIQGYRNIAGMAPYVYSADNGVTNSSEYEVTVSVYNYPGYSYTVFPAVDGLNKCRLTVWAHAKNTRGVYGCFEVGIMTDANDINSFEPIDTIETRSTEWGRYTVDFDGYEGTGKFVAFKSVYSVEHEGNVFVYDNLKIDEIPQCLDVQNVQIVPDETSAEITWDAMTAATGWEVKVSAEKISYDEIETTSQEKFLPVEVTGEKAIVSGLEPREHVYYVWIRPVCEEGTYGDWSMPYEFKTICLEYEPLPYVLDGEGYSFNNRVDTVMPIPCVYFENTEPQYSYMTIGSPYLDSYKAYQGDYSFSMSAGSGDSWISLPDFNKDTKIQDVQVSFMLNAYDLTDTVYVGVMENQADINTFTLIKKFSPERENTWEEYVCQFTNYTGNGRHITFLAKALSDITASEFNLDTITVGSKDPCLRVVKPRALDLTNKTANLTWENGGEESEWYVIVSTRTYSASELEEIFAGTYEGEEVVYSDYMNSNPCQVEDLTADTHYYFYVRAVCDKAEGVCGDWCAKPGEFRTKCDAIIPDATFYDFETSGGEGDVPGCWSGTGELTIGDGSSYYGPVAHSGEYEVVLNTYYGGSYLHTNIISCGNIKEVQISFWAMADPDATTSVPLGIGVLSNPYDLATYVATDTLWLYPEWQYYTVTFDNYEGDAYGESGQYIMFSNQNLAGAAKCFIDDVSIDRKPECMPAAVTIDSIGEDGINVLFSGGTAPYHYVVMTENVDPTQFHPEESDIKTTQETKHTIGGLTPLTEYFLYVSSTCEEEGYLWSAPIRFTTSCLSVWPLPYEENFNKYKQYAEDYYGSPTNTTVLPDCWTVSFNGGNRLPTVYHGHNRADGNCLYIDMGSTESKNYMVLPKVNRPINECQVEFSMLDASWSVRTAQARVVIGVVEDMTNETTIDTTFVGLDTITRYSDVFAKCKSKLDMYEGEGENIAILVYVDGDAYGYDMYLDDIVIRHTPKCPMPFDPQITQYDDESITIEFDNEDGGDQWEYKCVTSGTDPETANAIQFSTTTEVIHGLMPETRYDIYLRTLCPEETEETDQESEWVMVSGRTSAPAVKEEDYPLEDDMSENKDDWKPTESEEIEMVNQWYIADKTIAGETGTMMYISNDGGTNCDYSNRENSAFIHRVMKFDVGRYTLSFKYNVTGYEDWGSPADYLSIIKMPEAYTIGIEDNWGETLYLYDEYGEEYEMGPYGDDLPEDFVELGQYYLSGGWKDGKIDIDVAPGEEGIFKLVFMWKLDGYSYPDETSPAAAIKDFTVEYMPCVEPSDVKCDAMSASTAELSWKTNAKEEYKTYDVYVTSTIDLQTPPAVDTDDAGKAYHNEVGDTSASVEGLTENTPYIAFVRLKCGEGDYSAWSAASAVFRTDCGPAEVDRLYGFEEEEGHEAYFEDGPYNSYYLPECFTNGHKDIASPVTDQNAAPDLPYVYQGAAHTGSWSLSISDATGAYIVMPDIEGDMSGLQLTFWMRCFEVDPQTDRVDIPVNHPLKSDRVNALRIGTVTDMHDISTFEEIRLCDYPYDMVYIDENITMDTDPNELDYWVKFNVPLKGAEGKFITFLSDDFVEPYQNVFIDDVKIEAVNTKAAPYELAVTDIQPTSAHVGFKYDVGSAWTVEVAEDRAFTEGLQEVDATQAGADVTGLKSGTVYYVRAIQKGVDGAEYSPVTYFSTAYAVSFNENFDVATNIPRDWMTMNGNVTPDMLFDGTGKLVSGSGFSWNAGNDTIPSHMRALHLGSTDDDGQSIWLVTPAIAISTEGDRAHMMFDYGTTIDQNSYEIPTDDRISNEKNKFAILVSDDGGTTWKKENSTIWTNDTAELKEGGVYKSFTTLPIGLFHEMTYDLSKFRGKTVMVAFYNFSDENTCLYFHIDDIHINNVKDVDIQDDICEFDDYHKNGFNILDKELVAGLNSRIREVYTTTDKPDTIYSLDLTMNPLAVETYDAQICESELPYTDDNGFELYEGMTARTKVMQDGCYVIKEVSLTVNPTQRVNVFDTICQGAEIVWNGITIDRTGQTEYKSQSTVTGCDSITVMNMLVKGALEAKDTVIVCYGETYNFGHYGEIGESGDYESNIPTDDGCDSIVQLHLIVRPQLDTIINALICPDEVYTENNFNLDRPGTYSNTVQSPIAGCDSTVTLNLVQIVPDDVVEFTVTITENDLPFTFFTKTFDESYKPGSYTEDIEVEKEGCSGTIRLTLIVEEGVKPYVPMTEADNREMYITPNPVKVGSEVTLDIDLTDEEREGMTVNVYNAAGALVKSMTPGAGDIKVNCYFSPGIYVVRLTTGTGLNYQGKIIVQ